MRVSVSLYALHLHATPFTVGVLMALYALLPMLSAVSMGRLIDRIGSRVPMLIGSVAIALGALVAYLWPALTALHLTSVLIGSGFMMYQVAAQNIIGYIGRPEDRPMTFSLAALGFSVSGFVGPMLAGFGIDAFGHIATFGAFTAFPLLPIAVLGLNKLHLPQPHTHAPPPEPGRSAVALLRHRVLRHVFVASGLLAAAWNMSTFPIPISGPRPGSSPPRTALHLR